MAESRRDFGERSEDEVALEHTWMRHLEVRLGDDSFVVEEDVQVDEARALGEGLAASHVRFDAAESSKKFAGREASFGAEGGVEEPGLVEVVDRFCFVETGDLFDSDQMAI